jgi:parvulin-like peptidyl-prolyl isomerase
MENMRRVIAFVVVALVGAAVAGFWIDNSALKVNDQSISDATLRADLTSIQNSQSFECYLTALYPENWGSGAGGATMAVSGVTAWTNLRVEGLALEQFVAKRFKFKFTPSVLDSARSSLIGEMTSAAATANFSCPTSADVALSQLPTSMVNEQLKAQAASLVLVNNLTTSTPLTTPALEKYFAQNSANYDEICVSIALVTAQSLSAFEAAQAQGESVATLAKDFSVDASAKSGGSYGCYGPSSSAYASVRSDVNGTALGHFQTQPFSTSQSGVTYALFVAPTKKTPVTYAQAASAVLSDVQSSNANSANTVKEEILYADAITVNPNLGRWGLDSAGPATFVPSVPAKRDTQSASLLSALVGPRYK